jgi:hypothetical protein
VQRLQGRRALVVMDDATSAEQVRRCGLRAAARRSSQARWSCWRSSRTAASPSGCNRSVPWSRCGFCPTGSAGGGLLASPRRLCGSFAPVAGSRWPSPV